MNKKNKTNHLCETKVTYQAEHFANYPVVFEKNKNGSWTVTCPILPGCISEGDTKEAAKKKIKDAIQLYLRAVKRELQMADQKEFEFLTIPIGI